MTVWRRAPVSLRERVRAAVMRWFFVAPDRLFWRWPAIAASRWNWMFVALDWVQGRVAWATCRLAGHHPEPDQCLMPEHDLCRWCGTSMPYSAQRGLQ